MAWLVLVCIGWSHFLVPSLAYCLIPELGLTHVQFTLIFTGPILVSIFSSLPGGALADRYGIRSVVAISIFMTGAFGLARAFTGSFAGIFALMCLFGIPLGMTIPTLPKLVSIWFPRRQAGLASGIYATALGIGASLGLLTGPLFGGVEISFHLCWHAHAGSSRFMDFIWQECPERGKNKHAADGLWCQESYQKQEYLVYSYSAVPFFGAFISFSQNFPKALENAYQVVPAAAGAVASLLSWGAVVGHVVIPSFSDRVGLRKPFIYVGALASAACLFSAWHLAPGTATSILVFFSGFLYGGIPPILLTFPLELPEIGQEHVGGAAGLVGTLGNIGGFLIPLLVVSPLMATGTLAAYTTGFSVIAILFAAIALPTIFTLETGTRAKSHAGSVGNP